MSRKKKSVPKYIMNIYILMIVLTSSWDLFWVIGKEVYVLGMEWS